MTSEHGRWGARTTAESTKWRRLRIVNERMMRTADLGRLATTSRTTGHDASSRCSATLRRPLIERVAVAVAADRQTHRSRPLLSVLSPCPAPREISRRRRANNQSHGGARNGGRAAIDGQSGRTLCSLLIPRACWRSGQCRTTVQSASVVYDVQDETVTSSLCKHFISPHGVLLGNSRWSVTYDGWSSFNICTLHCCITQSHTSRLFKTCPVFFRT